MPALTSLDTPSGLLLGLELDPGEADAGQRQRSGGEFGELVG